MAFCCGITYFFILHFAPYIYSYTPSDVEWFADELAQELSMTDKGETAIYFSIANDTLTGDYNNEYLFHLFNSDGEEVSLTDTATATGKQIDDYNPKETSAHYTVSFIGEERPYTLLLAKNTDKESQAVEALHKALPALTIVIVAISVLAAVFYAWYMTAPIKKISKMSKQMANMDFGSLCPVERTDEIGVLSDSLNTLSSNLSAALTELKDANQKLQADIDKERELELQRIKFFSAASHELKTPITIIKGQLQGMLCGVGRYKDRETYLAQSLEVTNSLEKMVQELLTVSRIEAPQYSCVKTHFDFTQFLRQRLAAFDDLFVQKELSVAINLLPGIYIDGDIGLLQKVVDNLLGNAATYSPPGNSVRVDLRQAEEKVYLTIENMGVHIPEDDISKLFEPFYRVEQSRNRQTGGSGLGLYIVKTIINLHNAEISVQNTDDGVAIKVIF
jgi:two-component system sensor histidine kinase VanS